MRHGIFRTAPGQSSRTDTQSWLGNAQHAKGVFVHWYYVQDNQQAGPVSDAALSNLAVAGVITSETLLWRPGMQDWQPARIAAPELTAAAATPDGSSIYGTAPPEANAVRCAACGNVFPSEDVVYIGQHPVCASCKPLYVQRLREGVPVTGRTEVQFGGFWLRFVAKIVDGIILMPVSMGLMFVYMFLMLDMNTSDPAPGRMLISQFLINILMWAVNMAYVTFFVGRFAATPGKMVCGLRVVTGDLGKVTYLRAFGRFWGEFVTGMTFTIGYIIAAFDSEKRALHDYICNTRVIRV